MRNKKYVYICILVIIILLFSIGVLFFVSKLSNDNGKVAHEQQSMYYKYMGIASFPGKGGYYYTNNSGFLHFYEYQTEEDVIVCNKPNCKHQPWDNDTPEEQRCNAYLSRGLGGFVSEEKLYLLSYDNEKENMELVSSDLDRSNQSKLAEIDSSYIQTLVVKDQILYLANSMEILGEDKSGLPTPTGENYTWMCAIDLNDGKVKELSEREKNYSAELYILGINAEQIYLRKSYFENRFDGTNFEDAKQHEEIYSYDIKQNEYKEILSDNTEKVTYTYLNDSTLIGYVLKTSGYEIIEMDMKSGNKKSIYKTSNNNLDNLGLQCIGKKVYFYEKEHLYSYDMGKQTLDEIKNSVVSQLYVWQDAGAYLYGAKKGTETENASEVLISKEDVYEDKPDYIYLKE